MARPGRNSRSDAILSPARIFFATTKASMGRRLLQSERNAALLIDVLRSLVAERKFKLHDFVIMPDHVHLLLTVEDGMTIEKAMQLIKGRFSHRLTKEFGHLGEVWQRGFSEVQVLNRESFMQHRAYIATNPVKEGLVDSPEQYPYCFEFLANKKAAGAEALVHSAALSARLKSCPDTKQEIAEDRSDQPSNIQKAESE
jgi:putative transposase